MKRFYRKASTAALPEGHAILLDGVPIRTPAKHALAVPSRMLAEAIAGEWLAQEEKIDTSSMPLTQFAATALDHVTGDRAAMTERLLAFVDTDMLCHRAAEPPALRLRQNELWDPPLAWAQSRYDIHLHVTTGIIATDQPPAARQRLARVLEAMNDWEMIGLQTAALASGSIILALALKEGHIAAGDAFAAAELEASFQAEKWGLDADTKARQEGVLKDLKACEKWFALLGSA